MEIPFAPNVLSKQDAGRIIRGLIDGSLKNDSGERFGLISTSAKQVRVTDESPSGTGKGCGNAKFYLDSYGTATVDGSFAECLDFLETNGFLADGHGAAFGYHYPLAAEVGIFTKVYEDSEGLQLEWEYHDDEYSQGLRNKTAKRLNNGKFCGMSIGFYVGDGINNPTGWTWNEKESEPSGVDYVCIVPQDYERAFPDYFPPEFLQENLERAQNFWCVYILKRVHVFETSQTQIPANEISQVAELRARRNSTTITNTMAQLTDAEIRAKKDAKREAIRESLDAVHRAFKKAKEAHDDVRSHHDEMEAKLDAQKKAHGELAKRVKELDSHFDDAEEDDDDTKRSGAGRAAFNGGR